MLKLLLITILIVGAVSGIRSHPGLAHGWTGGCTVVGGTPGGDSEWRQCHAGRLEGKPDLRRDGCTPTALGGPTDLWRCPAPVSSEYRLGG
jgi:hypothetical protein